MSMSPPDQSLSAPVTRRGRNRVRAIMDCAGRAGAATALSGTRGGGATENVSCVRKRRGAALPTAVQDTLARWRM